VIKWKLVAEFILTVIIPLTYLYNILIIVITPNSFSITPILKLLGICIAIFGLIFWIVSLINLRKSFGVLPQKQKKVKQAFISTLIIQCMSGFGVAF